MNPTARRRFVLAAACLAPALALAGEPITTRTEYYQRPDKDIATYFVYERAGQVVCTSVKVCNGAGACSVRKSAPGPLLEPGDAGLQPYSRTRPKPVVAGKAAEYACLAQHGITD